MASNRRVRLQLNHRDLEEILKAEALDACEEIGEKIRQATGAPEDYEVQEYVGENRGRVTVRTIDDWGARSREARDHNLIRALGSVGD